MVVFTLGQGGQTQAVRQNIEEEKDSSQRELVEQGSAYFSFTSQGSEGLPLEGDQQTLYQKTDVLGGLLLKIVDLVNKILNKRVISLSEQIYNQDQLRGLMRTDCAVKGVPDGGWENVTGQNFMGSVVHLDLFEARVSKKDDGRLFCKPIFIWEVRQQKSAAQALLRTL